MIEQLMNECAKLRKAVGGGGSLRLDFDPNAKKLQFTATMPGFLTGKGETAEEALQALKRELASSVEKSLQDRRKNLEQSLEQIQKCETVLNEVGATNVQAQQP